jgi:hypothetical protein
MAKGRDPFPEPSPALYAAQLTQAMVRPWCFSGKLR